MSKHIFWIASYPKSGNTLMRAILASLFFSKDGKFDFEMLQKIPKFEETKKLDFLKKINFKDYNDLQNFKTLSKYWTKIQSKENLGFKENFIFLKTHHALLSYFNNPFTTAENTVGIIYLIRDPRDVAISWAHHTNESVDESINFLLNDNAQVPWGNSTNSIVNKKKIPISYLSNWENNCLSWINVKFKCPKLILRYEDLIDNKKDIIIKIISFFEKNYKFKFNNINKKINNILNTTNFNLLKKKEEEIGFNESVHGVFFRKGRKNQWEDILGNNQIKLIENKFSDLMLKYKYKLKF